MKVYISVDMEGVTGVAAGDQVRPGERDYDRFRRLMTQDANAAVEGALASGATEIVVNDGHDGMTNLLIEELHPEAQLISGVNKLLLQLDGIDPSCDALFCVGYHQREGGGDGVLNHTFIGKAVYEVRLNGEPVDELTVNAALAGHYGVPLALVTGDSELCRDAEGRFPGVEVAPVKWALDRYAARSLTPARSHQLIRDRAQAGLRRVSERGIQPFSISGPVSFEVDFKRTAPAHMTTLIPGVERRGPRTVGIIHDDLVTAFKTFTAALLLGTAVFEGTLG